MEIYGLCSQIAESGRSIAANIAEGFRKRGLADKLQAYEHCRQVYGSQTDR